MLAHNSPAAACATTHGCNCAGGGSPSDPAYSYISLSHQFVPDGAAAMDISSYSTLNFWVKSDVPFDMAVKLDCQGPTRPMTFGTASDGYLDSAFINRNPCWIGGKAEMASLAHDPMQIHGGAVWVRYSVPLSAFTDVSGGGLSCGLTQIRSVSFVMTDVGLYYPPLQQGLLYFDDLVLE
jgi:hypothetical protein